MLKLTHPTSALPGVPMENAFQVVDENGMKCGSATVIEYINEAILPERPLNYYINLSSMTDRAFDMLVGAVLARAIDLRKQQPEIPARIYVPCKPNDADLLRSLQAFGFQNDDAEIRMRRVLSSTDRVPLPPVGCVIAPVILENEEDCEGLLQRINRFSLTTRTMEWLARLQQEQLFVVFGVWQDQKLLAELVLTAYGTEGRVEMLYTRTKYRNRGIATSLIAHVSDALQQSGIRTLNAEVWRRNGRAMSLFQKMSFDSVQPVTLYPGIDV